MSPRNFDFLDGLEDIREKPIKTRRLKIALSFSMGFHFFQDGRHTGNIPGIQARLFQ
jgi:hypothetical protein